MIITSQTRGRLLRWTAVLTGVGLAVALGSTPAQAAVTDPQTVVSFTFDDGNADQLNALPALDAHGMKATFFITSGWIGASGYMTIPQLTTLKTDGHEIGGHTVSHPDLTTLPADELKKQICQGRNTLDAWGFPTTSFAYPYANVNAAAEQAVIDCGYRSARNLGDTFTRFGGTAGLYAETMPPADPFQTRAPDEVDSTWTLADLQKTVTDAESNGGGWVELTFHHVCDTACDPLNLTISPALLQEFTTWLALRSPSAAVPTNNTVVKTVGEVIGGTALPLVPSTNSFRPAPGPGVNGVINPGLELAGTTGGAPQCWQPGGFGVSTATFTTLDSAAEAHSGTKAEQLVVTGLVSGDAKLVLMQDLGTCAPTATPGHTYSLRSWYKSTVTTQFDVYYRNEVGGWIYWTSSPYFAATGPIATSTYTQATWTTPPVPAGSTGISFGLNLISNGTLVTDDYSLYDSVGAPFTSPTSRVTGVDRMDVAVQISKSYTPGVSRVYVANGYNFPDALSAAPAAAHFKVPVLLTTPDSLPATVKAEITRLNPGQIVIAGGPASVSANVLAQLQTITPTVPVVRLGGADRYAASRAIAQDAFGGAGASTAYIATGANFPDALAAAPAAAHFGGPVILVPGSSGTLDAATSTLLTGLHVTSIKIAGGPASLSVGIENGLRAVPGVVTVKRNFGADRYAAAAAINFDTFLTSPTVYLASGEGFPDALVGAALAGSKDAPLYLTPGSCVDKGALVEFARLGATSVVLFGGPATLSENVMNLVSC